MSSFGANATGAERTQLAVNTIRLLSADAIQAAKSGHPGMPMGMADVAHVLYTQFLRVDPKNPNWVNRDRFMLSGGHGSMLAYSMLHLGGFDLSMDEIKRFRQLGSKTPGHPEVHDTPGIDMTAGPLGAAFASAVGFAMAERMLAQRYNTAKHAIIDHFTYVFMGDGCMMEGVTHEAASIAGHLKLGKMIAFYDDNEISIEGNTNLTFTENVNARYEAYGWQVIDIDGHNHEAIANAIRQAQADTARPSLIVCHTIIGKGAPHKAGTAHVHGEPLGAEELAATKKAFGWPENESFLVPDSVRALWSERQAEWQKIKADWQAVMDGWTAANKGKAAELSRILAGELPRNFRKSLPAFETGKGIATRQSGGDILNALAQALPELVGGSADLAPSTKTELKGSPFITATDFSGRNIHYGVREHAMGHISNGLALHGGFIPFCASFLVFTDFARPAIRLSALMHQRVIYYFTHDSIFVGEDGPTHQPVEHLASYRCMPNLWVMRPAEATEAVQCMAAAVERQGPTLLCMTRQNLTTLPVEQTENAAKGGYILKEAPGGKPDCILMASGSEIGVALAAYDKLVAMGKQPRVVSMPCMELFEEQKDSYKRKVFPSRVRSRVAIEAAVRQGWDRYIGDKGVFVGMSSFGASGPAEKVAEKFGFTADNVIAKMTEAGYFA